MMLMLLKVPQNNDEVTQKYLRLGVKGVPNLREKELWHQRKQK